MYMSTKLKRIIKWLYIYFISFAKFSRLIHAVIRLIYCRYGVNTIRSIKSRLIFHINARPYRRCCRCYMFFQCGPLLSDGSHWLSDVKAIKLDNGFAWSDFHKTPLILHKCWCILYWSQYTIISTFEKFVIQCFHLKGGVVVFKRYFNFTLNFRLLFQIIKKKKLLFIVPLEYFNVIDCDSY